MWWLGICAAASGAALAFWAWHADRSHGRRRCPKCWYDMTGAPTLRCPECGHDARSVRRLYRTRRSKWGIAFGLILIVSGIAGPFAKDVHDHGWAGASPTWALAIALPRYPDAILDEFDSRLRTGRLSARQAQRMFRSALLFLESQPDSEALDMAAVVCTRSIEKLRASRYSYSPSFVQRPRDLLTEAEIRRVRRVAWSILDNDRRSVRRHALPELLFASGASEAERAALVMPLIEFGREFGTSDAPWTIRSLERSSKFERFWDVPEQYQPDPTLYGSLFAHTVESEAFVKFCRRLRDCDGDATAVRQAAIDALSSDDELTQSGGAYVLTVMAASTDELCDLAHAIADAPRAVVRRCAAWWLVNCGDERIDRCSELLVNLLKDPTRVVRKDALQVATERGIHTEAIDAAVVAMMREMDNAFFIAAIEYLHVHRYGQRADTPLSSEFLDWFTKDDDVDFLLRALHYLGTDWSARQNKRMHDIVRALTQHDDETVAQRANETMGFLSITK